MEGLVSLSPSKDLSKPGFFTPDVPDEQVSLAWGKRVVDRSGKQMYDSCAGTFIFFGVTGVHFL